MHVLAELFQTILNPILYLKHLKKTVRISFLRDW